MKILLFAGAGTSIELGVPGMMGLAEEFVAHCKQWNLEPGLVERMIGASMDIEHLIEEADRICIAKGSLATLGQDTQSLEKIDKIRAEVEWFVQHAAERITPKDAYLMWGPLLRRVNDGGITLVTTNYDRAIELAANRQSIDLDDGFVPFDELETATWRGFVGGESSVQLVKLHGSTDWYADGQTQMPLKLRHPMPLFGRATLQLTDRRTLGSALVLPSREKLLTRAPYPRLSQAFLNAIDHCDLAIFVGSSLRDAHIRDAAQSVARRVPTLIVNPTSTSCDVEGAFAVQQYASTFLISTLPDALGGSDPVRQLTEGAQNSSGCKDGVLALVRVCLDTDETVDARCRSIEELDSRNARLDLVQIESLLNDHNPVVAQYALSLIPGSSSHETLLARAKECPHIANQAYVADLRLLEGLVA